jgi:hypothetical protein
MMADAINDAVRWTALKRFGSSSLAKERLINGSDWAR